MAKSNTGNKKTFRINNMTGLVNTTAEDNAYLTLDPNANLGVGFTQVPFEFKRIENWLPTRRGGLRKTFGFDLYKNVGSSTPITGLYRFIRSSGTSYFIVSYGNTVYTLSAGVLTSTTMAVTNLALLDFQTAYDYLVVCDGANDPQKWDGTTVSNLTTGADATAADGARQSLFYQDRLFLFSSTHDESLLYFSNGGDITTGYASNFINCDVEDGQKIKGIARFFIPGQIEPIIIVGKERSLGIITGDGQTTNPFTFIKIADDIGITGFRHIVQFEQDAAFLTLFGISSYTTSVQNQNLQRRMLTEKIANQFTNLSPTTLPNSIGWLDGKRRRFSFAVPINAATWPNKIWHYDIDLKGWYAQTGFDVTSVLVDTDGTVYTGTSTGLIYIHDEQYNNYDGAAINSSIETPYLDFFQPHYYKRFVDARVVARGDGDYGFGISTSLNNGTAIGTSHTIELTTGAYTWNGGTWNSTGTYLWGASPLTRKKFFPGGIFENASFNIVQAGVDEPVDFLEMILEVETLNLI